MELKYYDKQWLPAIKGTFLIILGILLILNIVGTIVSLGFFFAVLIAMIGILLIASGIFYKKSGFRILTIVSGVINLAFFIYLVVHVDSGMDLNQARTLISSTVFIWLLYYALYEFVEAGILLYLKNAFGALFIINGILTSMFGFFVFIVIGNSTPQGIFYLGLMAIVIGIVNELSAYLLSRVKQ
jgi:hypothetical protein